MTRKRTILVILGAFILGALCGGGGAMLVAGKQAAANQENAVGFLEGLDLGTLVDQCKPAEARYIPARNRPRTRDEKADNQQTALPSKAIQVQWAGETSRMTLLDKVVTQLRLHFQKQGYLLRLMQSTEREIPGKSTFDHRLYRCEDHEGTCVGMISVIILTRDAKECTVSIACASAGHYAHKDSDRPS